MLKRFFPDMNIDSIQDISIEMLLERNIKGVVLDIDNTLVPQHMKDADENATRWIEYLKAGGIKACIVSNASQKRVIRFNEKLQILALHRASKPSSTAFLKAAKLMELEPSQIAVVGDQIFTDIFGGNRIGMFTILVKPIDKREFFLVRMKRLPEKIVLRSYRKHLK